MEKDENNPSTSAEPVNETSEQVADDEMKQLCEVWGEKLEEKSVPLNLTHMNVKSIVHHFCKYPSTFDVLMGIKPDSNIPNMRVTRSHRKNGETSGSKTSNQDEEDKTEERAILFESLYQNRPNTFLDLDFDDNDEFDEDYSATTKENEDEEEDDGDDSGDDDDNDLEDEEDEELDEIEEDDVGKINKADAIDPFEQMDIEEMHRKTKEDHANTSGSSHVENLNDSLIRPESCLIPHIDNSYERDEFRSYVNPEYRDFINAVNNQNGQDLDILPDDDPDDEDYDIQADGLAFDVDDWDETRRDRTTEISRNEVEKLMIDTILAEKEIPANAIPKEAMEQAREVPKITPSKKTQKEKDAEAIERLRRQAAQESNESCSLIANDGKRVTFREEELKLLKIQLEQHVQLLTQTVVTCYCDENLINAKNSAQLMINELETTYSERGNASIFNISNLGYSVEACHDIIAMEKVDEDDVLWAKSVDGDVMRPEAIVVLSRSNAIRYPHLLPKCQPHWTRTPISFLPSENVMLAVGLMQFAHLPRKKTKIDQLDRYTAIHLHCLPTRNPDTIRNRMKTIRANKNPEIHKIIVQAEEGTLKLEHSSIPSLAFDGSMKNWPLSSRPDWYNLFHQVFEVVDYHKVVRRPQKKQSKEPIEEVKEVKKVEEPIDKNDEDDDDDDEPLVITPEVIQRMKRNMDDEYINLGTLNKNGKRVIMKKKDVAELVNCLFPNKDSSSKRRKMATPVKISDRNSESSREIVISEADSSRHSDEREVDRDSPVSTTNREDDDGEARDSEDVDERSVSPKELREIVDENSTTCFTNPPTPGKRPPSECTSFDMLEGTSIDQFDIAGTSNSRTFIPRTPRYDENASRSSSRTGSSWNHGVTDFRMMETSQNQNLEEEKEKEKRLLMKVPNPYENVNRKRKVVELEVISEESGDSETNKKKTEDAEPVVMETPIDFETDDDEERPTKRTKVRSRSEREEIGIEGMGDLEYRRLQEKSLGRKMLKDVGSRLFMHHEKWKQLREILGSEEIDDKEKVKRMCVLFENMPEILHLMLVFAPDEAVPREFQQRDPMRSSMKHAMEILMDIDAYFAASKTKSSKFIFKQIGKIGRNPNEENEEPLPVQKLIWENMDSIEAAEQMYSILGQHRPLWKKVEKMFYSLASQEKCSPEDFEYIDLTKPMSHGANQFENIDDIDQVLNPIEKKEIEKTRGDLVVRTGQMFASTKVGYVPVEVTTMKWNKALDMKLLEAYNRAIDEDPEFRIEQIGKKAAHLPFGEDAIRKRMEYLLNYIKKK